ncbi:hypothetical protein BKA59DRAFT_549740 [Fusarium tricinctum]|uniref:Uncharacterized protein n=1 Tax=Fusarium tricinctum TaxID=61284 RepID=A0A8K0RNV3_9HYPO|nr:hypothetical protein BKA59DRAFT_549740 [Fusarium tricinctum]
MVKITTVAVAALAALAPVAEARNCRQGLTYCGYVLLRRGNYLNQIDAALKNAGVDANNNNINQSLFYCQGGNNGDIQFRKQCKKGCNDGGDKHNDSCI